MNTLADLLDSVEYDTFRAETLLNPQYHIINDTGIDVDKMLEANKNGAFGVTHGDCIECMRDFVQIAIDDGLLAEGVAESIEAEIAKVEQFHLDKKTYEQFI